MLASRNPKIEDLIVGFLLEKPALTVKEIFGKLQATSHKISLQATYDVVRKLLVGEVLIKKGTKLIVSQEWLTRLRQLIPAELSFYPAPGESLRFIFQDFATEDAFWKHAFFQLLDKYPEEPIFLYVPHQVWPYTPGRAESEREFYPYFKKQKRHAYYSVGGTTLEDRMMRDDLKNEYVHMELARLNKYPLRHIAVVNDMLVFTQLRKSTEEEIDNLYKQELPRPEFAAKLTEILLAIDRVVFVIQNNRALATEIRKAIAKDYHVPREVVEKFNLW